MPKLVGCSCKYCTKIMYSVTSTIVTYFLIYFIHVHLYILQSVARTLVYLLFQVEFIIRVFISFTNNSSHATLIE